MSPLLAAAVLGPALFYGSLGAGDLASTEAALHAGAHEMNPLGQSIGARIALKTVSASAFTVADVKLQDRRGPNAWVPLWTLRVLYGGIHLWAIHRNLGNTNGPKGPKGPK